MIEAIHDVKSPLIEPYLKHNRCAICQKCALLHGDVCPCPMDYLSVLIVQAVETVDQRREQRERRRRFVAVLPDVAEADLG